MSATRIHKCSNFLCPNKIEEGAFEVVHFDTQGSSSSPPSRPIVLVMCSPCAKEIEEYVKRGGKDR